jgi:hypothetical protein
MAFLTSPQGFLRGISNLRQMRKTPDWIMMTMQRAKSILSKDGKQLSRSAKMLKTTPEQLVDDAQLRIRWQNVPRKDQPALKMFTMYDQPGGRERIIEAMNDLDRHYKETGASRY